MKHLALAVAALCVAATPVADHFGKIKWNHVKNAKDYDAQVELMGKAGKPALLYFTMDG